MNQTPQGRGLGWNPDRGDVRDHHYSIVAPPPPVALPPLIDLRPQCPPVQDQGALGSCVWHALGGAVSFLELKDGVTLDPISRLFGYFNTRALEGTIDVDAGCSIRDAIKTLCAIGACSESLWPYDITKFSERPPVLDYMAARLHRLYAYARIDTLTDMKTCLAHGFPFVLGITVYNSFESDTVGQTGIVPMPDVDHENALGGHAILAVGYSDANERLIIRNSWGTGWGQMGYCELPYAYATNTDLADDMWAVRRMRGF